MYCTQCGKQNQPNARFCEHCGASIGSSATGIAETVPENTGDLRTTAQPVIGDGQDNVLGNTAVFVLVYVVFMIPTYILPYFGSNSSLFISAWVSTGQLLQVPQFLMHVGAFAVLLLITWFRGNIVNKRWLLIFPILALVFDFVPVLSSIPLVPTVMHLLAIILGVAALPESVPPQRHQA